jgi:DNA primase
VGLEGKEAFERRLESTLPLSEYLIKELAEQSDLAHADGRARFSENARPLWAKLPEGVYRELMLARIAEVVGIAPQRLQELWQGGKPLSAAAAPAPEVTPKRVPARHAGGGRGSLVRQAVLQLVSYPAIALEVSDPERATLEACEEPGIELLRELIDNLRLQPARSSAQVIERWNGRPGGDSLEKLLQREQIVADAVAAAGELHATLGKLAHRAVEKRLEALQEKSKSTGGLEKEELLEFQRLVSNLASRDARGG